jgi:hypothetical protein
MVARNGEWNVSGDTHAMTFCWLVWRKGYTGKPQVSWISADKDLLQTA